MKYTFILLMLASSISHSQKGTFTIGGGGALMVSDLKVANDVEGYWSCCNKTSLKGITYFNYESNYNSKFLMFSKPDVDIIPTLEIGYNVLDKLRITSSLFGFKRTTKYKAGRYIYSGYSENYSVSYHEEAIRLGLTIGVNYNLLKSHNKHSLLLGFVTNFDKVIYRNIIEDYGTFSNTSNHEADFLASQRLPPFTGVNYILFSSLTYEYEFSDRWLVKNSFRYSPNLNFTRNYYHGRDTGLRMIYNSILAFDLQLVYRFGGDEKK